MYNDIIYTGIGSRETPNEINLLFKNIAKYLADSNFILRSGHANGADIYFEFGCDENNGRKEIYLPWKNFNQSNSSLFEIHKNAWDELEKIRKIEYLKPGAQKLLARDFMQVKGQLMNKPSNFLICYCKIKNGKPLGGTSIAYNFAKENNIPIFNVYEYSSVHEFKLNLNNFINKIKEGNNT